MTHFCKNASLFLGGKSVIFDLLVHNWPTLTSESHIDETESGGAPSGLREQWKGSEEALSLVEIKLKKKKGIYCLSHCLFL